jgi:hypothetical protein
MNALFTKCIVGCPFIGTREHVSRLNLFSTPHGNTEYTVTRLLWAPVPLTTIYSPMGVVNRGHIQTLSE